MRILHITNIISHHQLPLACSLASLLGEQNFRFAATQPPDPGRMRLGWPSETSQSWVLQVGQRDDHRIEFGQWCAGADVVLCGERLLPMISARLTNRSLTFYMSERWWKPPIGMMRLLHPRFASMAYRFRRLAQSPYLHHLPMGCYAARDMRCVAPFADRMWQWGYFTELPRPLPIIRRRGALLKVLWAGRMLSWKRVDTLIRAFGVLCRHDDTARLILIGDGPCRTSLCRLVVRLHLVDRVVFLSSMPAASVREQMRDAHVYVLPSNAMEGWGAVVNEAMSEGCAVVASDTAGSAKAMIRDGENGLLFQPGDWRHLGQILCQLASDEALRMRLAQAGQRTILTEWSPAVAADRLLAVSEALLSGNPTPSYSDGPMARV